MSLKLTSDGNQFNPSQLVTKVMMGLFKATPTLAKFANRNFVGEFENGRYAPGNTVQVPLPTYPQIQTGQKVSPTLKTARYATITCEAETGWKSVVREIDQVSLQLYLAGNEEEFAKQFIKPAFDQFRAELNMFLYEKLKTQSYYTVLPREDDAQGAGNERWGRFANLNMPLLSRARQYTRNLRMSSKFVLCMHSDAYYDMVENFFNDSSDTSKADPTNRYFPSINDEIARKGKLPILGGYEVYFCQDMPIHQSGLGSSTIHTASNPFVGYNPEKKCILLEKENVPFKYTLKKGDVLVIDGGSGKSLYAVDPITKELIGEKFVTVVTQDTVLDGVKGDLQAVPVSFLPIGKRLLKDGKEFTPEDITVAAKDGKVIYKALDSNGNILGTWANPNTSTGSMAVYVLGSHYKIFMISKEGLSFVNPPLAPIDGAKNSLGVDGEAKISMLTVYQGNSTAGANIIRIQSLWGAGVFGDAIAMIPYKPPYLSSLVSDETIEKKGSTKAK